MINQVTIESKFEGKSTLGALEALFRSARALNFSSKAEVDLIQFFGSTGPSKVLFVVTENE